MTIDPAPPMRLTPSEQSGKPNARVVFAFEVPPRLSEAPTLAFTCTAHDSRFDPTWCEIAACPIKDGIRGEVRVQIPDAPNAPAGRQEFLLTGVPHGENAPTLTAMGALTIVEDRCGKLALRPSFRWDDDGALTATLKIDNCGNLSLRSKVRLRCDDGKFVIEAEGPALDVTLAKDPVDVQVLGPPPPEQEANPVTLASFRVLTPVRCTIDISWSTTSDSDGTVELWREGLLMQRTGIGPDAYSEAITGDESGDIEFALRATDSDGSARVLTQQRVAYQCIG